MTLPTIRRGEKVFRSTGYLARERYGRHIRTIARWIRCDLLPAPDLIINGRRMWLDETLDRWDALKRERSRREAAGVDARV